MRRSLAIMTGILLLVGLLGALAPAWGQEVTAAIVGTVVDPSGAPIKGAAVVARDTERGTVWNAQTNDSGAFSILRLPVGTYTAFVAYQLNGTWFNLAPQITFVVVRGTE